MATSPFLAVPEKEHVASNRSAFAIADKFPVTPGHTLVVPRRLISTWWDATPEERVDLLALVDEVRTILTERHRPDGWNVGFNAGPAAGQTVDHLHLHVIPRYEGDVPDPRGGVRHVIPSKGNHLAPAADDGELALIDGALGGLLPYLQRHLRTSTVDRIDIVVSFVRRSGLELVLPDILDALDRDAQVRILTTDYLGITEPAALEVLLDLLRTPRDRGSLAVRVFRDPGTSFHPKAYLFNSSRSSDGPTVFVGSSNLTASGLRDGVEWNAVVEDTAEAPESFRRLWDDQRVVELTREVLDAIEAQPRPQPMARAQLAAEVPETPYDVHDDVEPATPHDVQLEALRALEKTREQGHSAGLVVMATGLGKTFLAAFDARELAATRVLFVAHRKEILTQARDSFRTVMPEARMGLLVDGQDDAGAPVLFASVPSLLNRLDDFARDAFEYIVVDEFHHAAAESYRRIIDHFTPHFLLGLTATPDRLDGGDILSLCGDNEVFRCDLVDGIDRDLLSPFRYHGVLDPTDYAVIPWRSGRFVESALETAVATDERAQLVFDEWSKRRGQRTLAFCVSQAHADFMAAWFEEHGVRSAAVHSGPTSAPRHASVARLEEGDLDILFSVDVFNEGFDAPAIDTVLMLRPTSSPVIFLQQLGRGLRRSAGKEHLTVVDLIGNHESFLLKPRMLLSLGLGRTPTTAELRRLLAGDLDMPLPDGCSFDVEVGVIDLLSKLLDQRSSAGRDLIAEYVLAHLHEEGRRPTKVQVLRAGLNPAAVKQPWFEYLAELGALDDDETAAVAATRGVLADLERVALANMTKAYKPVMVRAMLAQRGLRTGLTVDELVEASRRIVLADPRLVADTRTASFLEPSAASPEQWRALWLKNPIHALTTPTRGVQLFQLVDDRVELTVSISPDIGPTFDRLVGELVDHRLAKYLVERAEGYVLKVSNAGDRPIIRFDRARHPRMPDGEGVPFVADGRRYLGDFRKIALNVARLEGSESNDLHQLLRGWFGADAGAPGTAHQVVFEDSGDTWEMRPAAGQRAGGWSDEQVGVLLDHYFEMLDAELDGRSYVKAEHNRAIQAVTGRSRGSIEFKLANVSAVLRDLGRPFIDGYKPRDNYQASLREAIEARFTGR